MKTYMTKWICTLCLLSVVLPVTVFAESQFFFVAREAASGSITAVGQNQQVVYLRWDVTEGKLPDDVVSLRLLRNGIPVSSQDWPANAVMSESEITNLYRGPEQLRRKLETINRLSELSASNGDDNNFSASNFANYLHELINPVSPSYNPFWAFLGSRTDFNIARARYRGWIDTHPVKNPDSGTGTVDYELLAVNSLTNPETTATLGKASVKLGTPSNLLGASNLRQILNSDTRCDLPENSKDHYTVALNWDSPGASVINSVITDRIASQFFISGFDLYRGVDNLAPTVTNEPLRDIASLAALANSDSRGNPIINGLEKVNVSLLIDSGSTTSDPKWLEARDLLQRAGLKPGDRRAYYLVPRDFTGNYGPTISALVEVPQMTRPPAPWDIRTFVDQTSSVLNTDLPDSLALSWNAVNLENYQRMFQGTRKYCNLNEAEQTGILDFVGLDESCETDVRRSVRLDVAGYRIYRFTDFDVAGRFKDSDGDGVADHDEISDINGDGTIDTAERNLGLQCDPTKQPSDANNYLLTPTEKELLFIESGSTGNPDIVRLRDTTPASLPSESKGTVFWYRIASIAGSTDKNGRLSFLSSPQRGLFPDRTAPEEPLVSIWKPGTEPNGCTLETVADGPWQFSDDRGVDEKNKYFEVSCASNGTSFEASDVSSATSSLCVNSAAACATTDNAILSFPATASTGNVGCDVTLPVGVNFCHTGSVTVVPTFVPIPAQAGDLVPGGVTVDVKPANNRTCIALFETIDGSSTRVANTCDPDGFSYKPGVGQFCGYAIATDENNNISASIHIPCTLAPSNPKPPGPPQLLSFTVDETDAHFSFRLPAEQVAVTMARLDHEPGDGSSDRKVKAIAVIDSGPGDIKDFTLPVESLLVTKDRFCLDLQAIAPSAGAIQPLRSPWSNRRCYSRLSGGEEDLPSYLPWPVQNSAKQAEPLVGDLVSGFRKVPSFLSVLLTSKAGLLDDCRFLLPGDQAGGVPSQAPEDSNRFDSLECTNAGMVAVKAALAPFFNFILYRQDRIAGAEGGDWIQASPLIDYVHFDDISGDKDAPIFKFRLNDPFVKFLVENPGDPDKLIFLFLDRYPFMLTTDYELLEHDLYEFRYQAVYFDADHRPVRWRQSPWFGSEG